MGNTKHHMSGHNNEASWVDGEAGTRQHYLEIDGDEATPREFARVVAAQPFQWFDREVAAVAHENESRQFRLLK